ncbi:hypothetical protein [Paenibacillus agilis]|uniref:Uncharacterized protein n=1 Tax=Paenibacillus agilis TaxID=3020863 RepID=A0A559ID60_9BACL|nr:hypothetical protein [Paenibacillus agilis]TVX85611.1 hypothetical protein FPZ44_24985 [Paenibacillus agilis]
MSEQELLELLLLKMWKDNGISEVFKYKNRIHIYRGDLPSIELFNDLTYRLFQDVEDIAKHADSIPDDYKVSIEELIKVRV